jgi:hypothetical protein
MFKVAVTGQYEISKFISSFYNSLCSLNIPSLCVGKQVLGFPKEFETILVYSEKIRDFFNSEPDILILCDKTSYKAKDIIDTNSKIVLLDQYNNNFSEPAVFEKIRLITCGIGEKNTITISSASEEQITVAVNRNITIENYKSNSPDIILASEKEFKVSPYTELEPVIFACCTALMHKFFVS